MATFRIKVSQKNLSSSVHSMACAVTKFGTISQGVFEVEEIDAIEAAKNWDEDNDTIARKIPATKICSCCGDK